MTLPSEVYQKLKRDFFVNPSNLNRRRIIAYTESGISEASFSSSDVETGEVDRWEDADIKLHSHVHVRTRPAAALKLHAEHCNTITWQYSTRAPGRRRRVPSSRRVGGEQNMMPSASVFRKPRCCVDVQTGQVNYVLCPSPSLPSSWLIPIMSCHV